MCRWLAYSGNSVYLDELLFKPEHSLIDQSLSSTRSEFTTNGDGFGVGWYSQRKTSGLYKSVRPAWNDANLRDLASNVESRLFLAHVRAATGTAVQHTNCHPFRHGPWLLVHNGYIREFHRVKRELVLDIDPELYPEVKGSTDSEVLFYLALTFDLEKDPIGAIGRMVGFVEDVGAKAGVTDILQMTLGLTDGERLLAVRYSSESDPPTLFLSRNIQAVRELNPNLDQFSDEARAIVSEPLGHMSEVWDPIPPATAITVVSGEVEERPLRPA